MTAAVPDGVAGCGSRFPLPYYWRDQRLTSQQCCYARWLRVTQRPRRLKVFLTKHAVWQVLQYSLCESRMLTRLREWPTGALGFTLLLAE